MSDGTPEFDEEYARASPALATWLSLRIHGALRQELSVQDALQEVACRAYAARASFDPGRGPFRAWVFGIARNVLRQALEELARGGSPGAVGHSRPDGVQALPDHATSVTQRVARSEELARLLERIDELSDDERALVVGRGLEGLDYDDIAARLGIEPRAAAKRWERLRERLAVHWSALELLR